MELHPFPCSVVMSSDLLCSIELSCAVCVLCCVLCFDVLCCVKSAPSHLHSYIEEFLTVTLYCETQNKNAVTPYSASQSPCYFLTFSARHIVLSLPLPFPSFLQLGDLQA